VETGLPELASSEMGKRNFGAERDGEEFIDVGVMGKDQFISWKNWICVEEYLVAGGLGGLQRTQGRRGRKGREGKN
jgi:hypothetical protein